MWNLKFIVKSKSRRKKILKLIKEIELTDENIQLIVDIIIECDSISQNLLGDRVSLYFERFDESYDGRNYTYSSKDYVRMMNGLESLELYSFKFSEKLLAYLESKLPEDKFLQILNYVNEMHSNIHENNDFNEEQKFVELGDKKIEYYRRTLSVSKQPNKEETTQDEPVEEKKVESKTESVIEKKKEKEEETLSKQSGMITKIQVQNINKEENSSTASPTLEELYLIDQQFQLTVEDDFSYFCKFDELYDVLGYPGSLHQKSDLTNSSEQSGPVLTKKLTPPKK